MERCIGCGHEADVQSHVVVSNWGAGVEARPVCLACWRHPEHRTTPIKGHFFPRALAAVAVRAAGSATVGN
jgi:hypothetical protein